MTSPMIPPSLAKYETEILVMLAAVARRKAELAFMYGRHDPVRIPRPAPRITDAQLSIKFWPLVGITAARSGTGGAWRAWTLAKSLDTSGRGMITPAALQALAARLLVHKKTWRRWMAEARRLGIITDRHLTSGELLLSLASQERAAVALACTAAGYKPASISAYNLVKSGWRAHVWAAYEQTHGGRPISRTKQECLTGVPISTQRAYDNQARVERRPNYAISRQPGDELPGVIEFGNRAAPFAFSNSRKRRKRRPVTIESILPVPGGAWQQQREVVAWRLPDSRTARDVEILPRGRSKKINKQIRQIIRRRPNTSSIPGRGSNCDAADALAWRLFFETSKRARAYDRKLSRSDQRLDELYILRQDGRNASLWDVMPLGGESRLSG